MQKRVAFISVLFYGSQWTPHRNAAGAAMNGTDVYIFYRIISWSRTYAARYDENIEIYELMMKQTPSRLMKSIV